MAAEPTVTMGSGNGASALRPPHHKDLQAKRKWMKEHMAACFRYMGREGYGKEGLAGHMSYRDPLVEHAFWTNPLGRPFSLMRASDLVLVDHNGAVVETEGGNVAPINKAAFAIHSALHMARADVEAAVHAHSIHGKAFASLGIELDTITQDSCLFYKDHAVYDHFGGVAFDEEEGRAIARALGDKKALILQNHGLLTTGTTIDEATFLFGAMDRCCHAQLLADAAAAGRGIKTKPIGEEEAVYTHAEISSHAASYMQFQPEYQLILHDTNGDFML
ncbi:hypothetical protein PYCC9005_003865 [Savitreella phatthalungensis]